MQRTWLVIAGLLLAPTACSHSGGTPGDAGSPNPNTRRVPVHVINNYSLPMEVYVIGVGINHRLGLVAPGVNRDFVLPETLADAGVVEFMAEPSGGGEGVRTVQVRFNHGDRLEFEISTNLLVSRATVK